MDFSNRKYLMAETPTSRHFSKFHEGDIIFKKGDEGSTMYEVISGGVGIYLHYGEPGERLLVSKDEGEFFGEIALLEKRPRTATAVSLYDGTVLEETSSAEGFVTYVRRHPQDLEKILDMMSQRFKEQRANYLNVCAALVEYKAAAESGEPIPPELSERIQEYLNDGARSLKK